MSGKLKRVEVGQSQNVEVRESPSIEMSGKFKRAKVGQSHNVEWTMEKVGQSAIQFMGYNDVLTAELEPSSELDKIVCGHYYSLSEHIREWKYISDSNLNGKYIIHRHNSKEFVLTHKKYETTLKQWLEKNENNWCPKYLQWNVCRPNEEARQIVQGILRAVHEFHSNSNFHGFLNHTENYLIRSDKSVIGGDCKTTKHIFLIHKNVELEKDFDPSKKNDIADMSNVIFNRILRVPPLNYPQDLQNLKTKLESSVDLELIVNHPSLWHWESRFSYIEHVWMQYSHAEDNIKHLMMKKFKQINVNDWISQAESDTLLKMMLNNKPYGKPYGKSISQLLRYLRNVHVHYKERVPKLPGDVQSIYSLKQYIEQKTTEVSELLLVHLYKSMCEMKM